MTRYVVDASVAIKWWVEEDQFELAATLIDDRFTRLAPDLLLLELGNVLLKKVRLGEISRPRAETALSRTATLTDIRPSRMHANVAFDVASRFQQTMYDATYVALALAERCTLVTADRRLFNALSPHLKDTMLWIADLPDAP